jgi:ABC-2 type transport system permease protein
LRPPRGARRCWRTTRVYRACLRSCLARELEFRGHFIVLTFSNCLSALLSLALASFVFSNVRTVAGWDLDRMIVLTGTFLLVLALTNFLFQANMMKLSELVNRGDLDFVLAKPISSQFLVSVRYVTFSELPATLVALAYVVEGCRRLGLRPGPFELAAYLGLIVAAILCFYALWFMSVTLVLWTGRLPSTSSMSASHSKANRFEAFAGDSFTPFGSFETRPRSLSSS